MEYYLFVLGRDSLLSLMEIISYLKARNFAFRLAEFNEDAALIEFEGKIDALRMIGELGGTVKIAAVELQGKKIEKEEINAFAEKQFLSKKFFWGINNFAEKEKAKEVERLGQFLKESFKELKLKAIQKHPKREQTEKGSRQINPSEVMNWNMVGEGLDLVIFSSKEKIFLGKTIACFNPQEFKKRDEKRPKQSKLEAISLRLAKIMLNLAQAKEKQTVFDPFCGIGTILQEALNNGVNAIGIDINPLMVDASEKNLEWYSKNYVCSSRWKIIRGDATQLGKYVQKNSFDCVVSEPFLGPLLREKPSQREASITIRMLEGVYEKLFAELKKTMREGSLACIIFPVIPSREGKRFAISESVFLKNGFKSFNPVKEINQKAVPFVYVSRKSRIERLIYVLKK